MTHMRYALQLAGLAVAAIVFATLFHFTRLDVALATPWYDPVNHTFPWRYAWITKYGVHRHLKAFELALGVIAWIIALCTLRAKRGFLATHRRRLWCVALSFVAVPAVIGILHRLSPMHCPWDIVEFGGGVPYFDLFTAPPPNLRAGHCFPAAFVSSGAWLMSLTWLWYPEHKVRSALIGVATITWAFGLGFVQQMRGAHFLSHTLWSLWVAWGVVLAVHYACGAWRETTPRDADTMR